MLAIRCYQCSTQTDSPKKSDSCGAYKRFNATQHIAIECNSDESHMPGSFCMKVVQQGPRGFICKQFSVCWGWVGLGSICNAAHELIKRTFFRIQNIHSSWTPLQISGHNQINYFFLFIFCFSIGDGRWRHVIRRCASVADTGVTGVCNWGVYENGDYWEECYCSHDACNKSTSIQFSIVSLICGIATLLALAKYRIAWFIPL